MKKSTAFIVLIGVLLVAVGAIIFATGVANTKDKGVTNTYDITEDFSNFDINITTSSLEFVQSDGSVKKVVVEETEKEYNKVEVVDNTLKITQFDKRSWYEKIINFDFLKKLKVTIYIPAEEYNNLKVKAATGNIKFAENFSFEDANIDLSTGDVNLKSNIKGSLKVETSTGDINLSSMNPKSLNVEVSTGKIVLKNVNITEDARFIGSTGKIVLENVHAANLDVRASTGDIVVTNVIITNNIKIKTSTGNIDFKDSDANTLDISTSTGHVKGNLLTSKIFFATSDTGRVNVPQSTTGGICEIKTDTGSIVITVNE